MRGCASSAMRVRRSGESAHSRTRAHERLAVEPLAQVAAVEPVELGDVEHRAADRDVLELEPRDHRREVHHSSSPSRAAFVSSPRKLSSASGR